MKPKICIITGANCGIGYESAKNLMEMGNWHVILACRSLDRAEAAVEKLRSFKFHGTCESLLLDLSSLESIYKFVGIFKNKFDELNTLVCNVSIKGRKRKCVKYF